ncbi:MAG: hypothetical protein LBB84_05625 [Tannerellaceae bacterium]|jgi:hypothetical protein|nr:hypothetical protein [Tannerellaceae bacterium]
MKPSTNASAESFNAKIKDFRATLRGVKHIPYFYSGYMHSPQEGGLIPDPTKPEMVWNSY